MSSCPPPRDYSQKVWCFQCGNEYFPDVVECVECGVATTTNKPPDVKVLGSSEDDHHLEYDFHEWTAEARSILENLLSGAQILHIWQGATLMVREESEAEVDIFISEVDLALRPSLDPSAEKVEYEMSELSDSQVSHITRALEDEKIPHLMSVDGDLIIHLEDEAKTEAIFETLESLANPANEYTFGPGVEGVDVPSLLLDLHRFSARIEKRETLTPADFSEGADTLDLVSRLDLPFGFSAESWNRIVERSQAVREQLIDGVDREIPSELQMAASQLKEVVSTYG